MVVQNGCFLVSAVTVVVVVALFGRSYALQHMVGDTVWSIPPNTDFYTNWSSSHFFQIGDTLLFDFESDLHNVMQVSRREYESCTAGNPFQAFTVGPAFVPLIERGVFYFICSVANYCSLGQRIAITVHQRINTDSAPTSSPSPSLEPVSPSAAPLRSQPPVSVAPAPVDNGSSSEAPAVVDWSMSVVGTRSPIVDYTGILSTAGLLLSLW